VVAAKQVIAIVRTGRARAGGQSPRDPSIAIVPRAAGRPAPGHRLDVERAARSVLSHSPAACATVLAGDQRTARG
jgi:hypothetical protein